jgi:hypothetical protein
VSREIPESDWRILRRLHSNALERFCQQSLVEIQRLASNTDEPCRDRYIQISNLVRDRNREMAHALDDMHRSQAIQRIACIYSLGLLTEEEFNLFSPGTRDAVRGLVELLQD